MGIVWRAVHSLIGSARGRHLIWGSHTPPFRNIGEPNHYCNRYHFIHYDAWYLYGIDSIRSLPYIPHSCHPSHEYFLDPNGYLWPTVDDLIHISLSNIFKKAFRPKTNRPWKFGNITDPSFKKIYLNILNDFYCSMRCTRYL